MKSLEITFIEITCRGMYKVPSKIITELREELEQLKLESQHNKEYIFNYFSPSLYSKLDSIKQELQLKNQYIHDLEGDVKQLKAMGNYEEIEL